MEPEISADLESDNISNTEAPTVEDEKAPTSIAKQSIIVKPDTQADVSESVEDGAATKTKLSEQKVVFSSDSNASQAKSVSENSPDESSGLKRLSNGENNPSDEETSSVSSSNKDHDKPDRFKKKRLS